MVGCELRKDGSKGGYQQYAYDGKTYIKFDKETLTWSAADVPAQITKRKWEADSGFSQYRKAFLEEECIGWLKKYLEYGKETLLRTGNPSSVSIAAYALPSIWKGPLLILMLFFADPPKVKVTRKADYDNMETLICRVDGFYPKDIDIVWTKDGEVWIQDTFHTLPSPNSDGTYSTWLTVKIDPKERERYKCHVEHDGLPEHVDLAWEEPEKCHDGYKAASVSDQGSSSSERDLAYSLSLNLIYKQLRTLKY
ncbi:hypothetical protein JD844_013912 [Phrynosoma platyrhinos]|uniref:Ig-like domain-containing protein n=1 Tax=Phrynosoma platyrhinos TaxID=52577 RepID=A0ABQ7TLT9_PHRPL|nr:hypothetical protein JD844_013912 [Phrynosoma platyrhinos]